LIPEAEQVVERTIRACALSFQALEVADVAKTERSALA
jgi:hypothetical protein